MWYIIADEFGDLTVSSTRTGGDVIYQNTHLHMVREKLDQLLGPTYEGTKD
jgi:propanediol utilization protein